MLTPVSISLTVWLRRMPTVVCALRPNHRRNRLNTAPSYGKSRPVICTFLSLFLMGCSATSTPPVNQQCVSIPASLTQPVLAPLPPAD